MPLYVYECPNHGRFEDLSPVALDALVCGDCDERMPRVYGYSMAITQPEVDVRGMFRRFTEATAETDHAATRIERSTGQPVESPRLWQAAKARAQAIMAAGENPYRSEH